MCRIRTPAAARTAGSAEKTEEAAECQSVRGTVRNAQKPAAQPMLSRSTRRQRAHLPAAAFQKDYPDIGYELLLGDYEEVERWLEEGRIECGFLRLPTRPEFETIFLKQDEYKVVLPKGHPLTECAVIEPHALDGQPFLLLEHGGRTEVSDLLTQFGIHPDIRFTTWEDYAILSMAEKGLGIGILPQMILQRIPYEVEMRPLSAPYYRRIGLAMKNRVRLSPAAKKFLEYLPFREAGADR